MEPQNSPTPEDSQQEAQVAMPQPIQRTSGWSALTSGVGLLAIIGGALFLLSMGQVGCLRGSTRSCRLKWEERDRQVETAIQEQGAQPPANAQGG